MRTPLRLLSAVCAVTLLACTESTGPTGLKERVAFDAVDNSNAAVITHFEGAYQWSIFDPEQQLLVFHNYRNAFPACGVPVTEITRGEFLSVTRYEDDFVKYVMQASPTYIWVWHSTNGSFLQARCTAPLAYGEGTMVFTDNDVQGYLPNDRMNVDAFGFSAHGDLVGTDGTHYSYNGQHHWHWWPTDLSTLVETTNIVFKAMP